MNILDRIVADKHREVALRKKLFPEAYWEQSPLFDRSTVSLKNNLQNKRVGIIAEYKRRSPSKSVINQSYGVAEVAESYATAEVGGMSVLTDAKYFGGSLNDLIQARAAVTLPLLRKEFIIDPYQLIEAKAHGADAILLIAAVLDRNAIKMLSETAQKLGLEVLLEVHNAQELEKSLMPSLDLIGVNNRDLKTFTVSLETSKSLAQQIPDDFVKVSESGISSPEAVRELLPYGFQGFLIGEHFMRAESIASFTREFIAECQK